MDNVVVAAASAHPGERVDLFEVRHDILYRPFGDSNPGRAFPQTEVRFLAQQHEHMGVMSQKRPGRDCAVFGHLIGIISFHSSANKIHE